MTCKELAELFDGIFEKLRNDTPSLEDWDKFLAQEEPNGYTRNHNTSLH